VTCLVAWQAGTGSSYLAEAEPGLRRIVTHNAASNSHMIAINEKLGFAVSGRPHLDVELAVGGES
jgi:RimJ/RimL family protein N-acetyltransferase